MGRRRPQGAKGKGEVRGEVDRDLKRGRSKKKRERQKKQSGERKVDGEVRTQCEQREASSEGRRWLQLRVGL